MSRSKPEVEYDRPAGKATVWHDHEDGGFTIEQRQVVDPILDYTRESIADTSDYGPTRWADPKDGSLPVHHVARVPMTIVEDELWKTGRFFDDDAVKEWLDLPRLSAFRTKPGRLK